MLNKFYTSIDAPYLADVSRRVYLTECHNHNVQCRNVEGQVLSDITTEGLGLRGISVDPDNNVYASAFGHNQVYRLDADLTRYKSVLNQTTGYVKKARALYYYRDKFFSHFRLPSLNNVVTMVRLLKLHLDPDIEYHYQLQSSNI